MSEKHMKKFRQNFTLSSLIGFLLLAPVPSFALDVKKVESTFEPGKCADPKADALETGRKLITRATVSKKFLEDWAKGELSSAKDQAELNWIRALNPWILPENFTSRTAFTECAAHLRTYSDAKSNLDKKASVALATQSLEEWKACLRLVYPKGPPREFALLQSCLK